MRKTENILIRVTPEEKKNFKIEAEKQGMTLSSLIINSVKKNNNNKIIIPDNKDILIQVRSIEVGISNLLGSMEGSELIAESDIQSIIKQFTHLKQLFYKKDNKLNNGNKRNLNTLTQ